jgi:hypothetical protein
MWDDDGSRSVSEELLVDEEIDGHTRLSSVIQMCSWEERREY